MAPKVEGTERGFHYPGWIPGIYQGGILRFFRLLLNQYNTKRAY